jgi:hypothetical protein
MSPFRRGVPFGRKSHVITDVGAVKVIAPNRIRERRLELGYRPSTRSARKRSSSRSGSRELRTTVEQLYPVSAAGRPTSTARREPLVQLAVMKTCTGSTLFRVSHRDVGLWIGVAAGPACRLVKSNACAADRSVRLATSDWCEVELGDLREPSRVASILATVCIFESFTSERE